MEKHLYSHHPLVELIIHTKDYYRDYRVMITHQEYPLLLLYYQQQYHCQ